MVRLQRKSEVYNLGRRMGLNSTMVRLQHEWEPSEEYLSTLSQFHYGSITTGNWTPVVNLVPGLNSTMVRLQHSQRG